MNESGTQTGSPGGKLIAIIVLCVILLILLIQNSHTVEINILLWDIRMSVNLLIPITGFVGFLIGMLVYSLMNRQKSK